jgi:hypothetical protein
MASFSSKWILSHSTWYKFRRSRQLDQHAPNWFNEVTGPPLFSEQWNLAGMPLLLLLV